jgi:hypothetical protein
MVQRSFTLGHTRRAGFLGRFLRRARSLNPVFAEQNIQAFHIYHPKRLIFI